VSWTTAFLSSKITSSSGSANSSSFSDSSPSSSSSSSTTRFLFKVDKEDSLGSLDLTTPSSTPSSRFEVGLDCEDDEKLSSLELDAILGSSPPLEASSVNTDFERESDRAVDSPTVDYMTSAEDVFLGSDSSSLESTTKIFFLCDSVDVLEDPRLVFELVAIKGIDHKRVVVFFSHLKTLDRSKSAQNNVSLSTVF
jgi:hypothetical protein